MESASARSKAIFTEAWGWRERLQRAMDGCHTTDDMSAAALAQNDEFEGPFLPLPCGYQVCLCMQKSKGKVHADRYHQKSLCPKVQPGPARHLYVNL